MVITRNGALVHPSGKEELYKRSVPRRIGELPSLRYGSVGANSFKSGPLRVTNHHYETVPRVKKSIITSSDGNFPSKKPLRRVRFALPPPESEGGSDGSTDVRDAEDADGGSGDGTMHTHTRFSISRREFSARDNSPGWFAPRYGKLEENYQRRHTRELRENWELLPLQNYRKLNYESYPFTSTTTREGVNQRQPPEPSPESSVGVPVPVTASPGVRCRIHPTGRYIRGTLSPTAATATAPAEPAAPGGVGQTLLRAARDADYSTLREVVRKIVLVGMPGTDFNVTDSSGRTAISYIASNGPIDALEQLLHLANMDTNRPDNEGNTPLHFAAQAGQVECLNALVGRCKGIEIDARNNLGFTPLMKAALQGRNKCAKLLLFAGANPTLRDSGRGLRADQWARFCGRYVCADVIEKHARHRLLERSTSYGNWGGESEMGARVLLGKVIPVPPVPPQQHGLKSKLKKVFRTSSGPSNTDNFSSARLVTQLTSAALCASSPVLPSAPNVPPVVKSLIRPLTVPRLQITLVSNCNNNEDDYSNGLPNGFTAKPSVGFNESKEPPPGVKPARTKKKK